MKILFLSDNFPPEVNAPATRTYEHCIEWVKQGAEVTVITCAPNFPGGKVYSGYKNKWRQEEYMEGIRVIRVWSYMASNAGFLKRILDYLSFSFSALLAGLFIKTDIIIATSPQFFTAVGGAVLAFLKRKPWVMEVRDIWPESIQAVGAINRGRLIKGLERIELFLYKRASHIVVVTDAFKENLVRRNVPAGKVSIIKNGVHSQLFSPRNKNKQLLEAHPQLKEKFVIAYIGTHGLAHNLSFILDCAQAIDNPAIHFLFIGDGAKKSKLLEKQKALQLKNVTFLPPVSKSEIVNYISLIDAALVSLIKSDTFKTVIPSKIFENAAMEKPILLGVEGESKALIQQYDAGLCYIPDSLPDFVAKLMQLYEQPALYKKLQLGCRGLAADFDRKKLALQILSIVENVV